jgi:nucleotide-binding universal stress UspA family protein
MKNILVPIDFSDVSLNALKHSYIISSLYQASINMLYVIESSNPLFKFVNINELDELISRVRHKFEELKKETDEKVGIPSHFFIEKGNIVDTILQKAKELDVKMLVMGTTGSSDIRKKIIGTNTLRVIKEASFPVLSIKNIIPPKSYKKIVLPLDLTKETTQKVKHAIKFAKFFDASIHLISVVTTENYIIHDTLIFKLEQTSRQIEAEDINCTTKVEFESNSPSKVANKILNYCYEISADLIMIMTQQETKLKSFFIGSLASEIVNKAKLPVLSINPE